MANYTPIEEVTFDNIPLTGVLVPGATVGYVAEGKFIKGGYIVVKTLEERDALLDKSIYEDKEIVIGTPVFVSDENKTYRYMGEDSGPDLWLEDTADLQQITENISDLQQIALDQKIEIDKKANQEDLTSLTNTITNSFTNVEANINAVSTNVSTLQEQVDKNTNDIAQRVDGNTFFAALMNIDAAINTKANTEDVNQQIEIINNNTIWDREDLTKYEVGGLKADSPLHGKSVKEILMMILYGYEVLTPEFDPEDKTPVITVTSEDTIGVSNMPIDIKGTIHFDRGEITLGGEHWDWMAGKVSSISIVNPTTGEKENQVIPTPGDGRIEDIPFTYHLKALPLNETELTLEVNYSEGPQPVDSFGDNFGDPVPAGTITTTIKLIGLTNTWTGTSIDNVEEIDNINSPAITDPTDHESEGMFQDLDENGEIIGTGFQIITPEISGSGQVPIVLIQDGVEITGIKVWDDLNDKFDWCISGAGEPSKEGSLLKFTKSEEKYEKVINSVTIDYYAYTYVGNPAGEMTLRFYID